MRFHTNYILALIAIIAVFLALRSWWIVYENDGIAFWTPIIIASLAGIYSGWCQCSRLTILISTVLAGLIASTSFALERVLHSPDSMFHRDRIPEMYYDDPQHNLIGMLFTTIISGGLGLCFGLVISRSRTWILVNRTELIIIGCAAIASLAMGMFVYGLGLSDFIDRKRFLFGTVSIGSILAVAWVYSFRSFPRSPQNAG